MLSSRFRNLPAQYQPAQYQPARYQPRRPCPPPPEPGPEVQVPVFLNLGAEDAEVQAIRTGGSRVP